MNLRPRDVPRALILAGVIITALHTMYLLNGCSSAQTHASIEKGAYAAEQGLCDEEATTRDQGVACLAKVRCEYSVFWPDAGEQVNCKDGGAP